MRKSNSGDSTPRRGRHDGPWPSVVIAWLVETWPTGMSAKDMAMVASRLPQADRVYTKGSIIGKARRLGLDARPSPLGAYRGKTNLILIQPPKPLPQLEPLESLEQGEPSAPPDVSACQYPHGSRPDYRFCGKPTWSCTDPMRSRVYCQDCYRACYMRHREAA